MQKPGDLLAVDVQHQAVLVDVDVDATNFNFPVAVVVPLDLSFAIVGTLQNLSYFVLGQTLFGQVTLCFTGVTGDFGWQIVGSSVAGQPDQHCRHSR